MKSIKEKPHIKKKTGCTVPVHFQEQTFQTEQKTWAQLVTFGALEDSPKAIEDQSDKRFLSEGHVMSRFPLKMNGWNPKS